MGTTRTTLSYYLRVTWRFRVMTTIVLILLPIATLSMNVVSPLVFAEIVDELIGFTPGDNTARNAVFGMIWILVGLKVVELVTWRTVSYVMPRLQSNAMRDLEILVHGWLMQMSHTFHTNNFGGSLTTKGRRFVNEYERLFDTLYFELAPVIIRLVAVITILSFRSGLLALVFSAWMVFYIVVIVVMLLLKRPYSEASAKADSSVTAHLADSITNVATVKAFGREGYEAQRFGDIVNFRHEKRWKSWLLDAHIRTVIAVITVSIEVSLLMVAVFLLFDGKIEVADVVLLQLYLMPLLFALWQLGRRLQDVETSFANAAEMSQILLVEPEVKDEVETPAAVGAGSLKFHQVSFNYHADSSYDVASEVSAEKDLGTGNEAGVSVHAGVFEDLNLAIPAHQKLGIVGPSGSGKSTIVKLLLRFHDVTGGTILIDGQPIRSVTQASLRQSIAYVSQEPILFHRSLADNIAYGKPDATRAEIERAAGLANADKFIETLPYDYETLVGERGTKLSGGEKQRVALARAFLKNAPILILDEATSALDSESEVLIQEALTKLMKDRTTIVIAHRLSTIQNMDRIVVLKNGEISEDGDHKSLLAANGVYAKLWSHQSGGFIS